MEQNAHNNASTTKVAINIMGQIERALTAPDIPTLMEINKSIVDTATRMTQTQKTELANWGALTIWTLTQQIAKQRNTQHATFLSQQFQQANLEFRIALESAVRWYALNYNDISSVVEVDEANRRLSNTLPIDFLVIAVKFIQELGSTVDSYAIARSLAEIDNLDQELADLLNSSN